MIPYTQCKGCVFAEMGDFTQTSCKLERASKLDIKETDEDGFFVLSRFCNTYRPEEWKKVLSKEESVNIQQTVMEEVYPMVGFFVLLETGETDAIKKLKSTLEDIQNQEKIKPKYIVVINDKVEYNQEIFQLFKTMFGDTQTKYHIVQLRQKPKTEWHKIDPAFSHAKNGWIYVTSSGEKVDRDLIYKIHKRVNIDMKKLVVVKPYANMNGMIFQTALFKFVNGNGTKLYQDEMIDSRSFLEKVESAAQQSGSETFISWSEFNES